MPVRTKTRRPSYVKSAGPAVEQQSAMRVPLRKHCAHTWLAGLIVSLAAHTWADPAGNTLLDPTWVRAPTAYSHAQSSQLRQAVELEALGRGGEAERIYAELARGVPSVSAPYGNAARALFAMAERTPAEQREARITLLERGREWAERGLAIDPRCTSCMLYKSATLGRLSTIYGVVWGARHVLELVTLLDRGIDLEPTEQDGPQNSTLGNLYFARATAYRTVPEWMWLSWVIGFRGDIERALGDIERARALHPDRLDYLVEHGVILLCRGMRREDTASTRAGVERLNAALARPASYATDHKDQAMARRLLGEPDRACEFSRDGFLSIEEHASHGST